MVKRFGELVRPTQNGLFFYILFLSPFGMCPGPHLEGDKLSRKALWIDAHTKSSLGTWAGDHTPFSCRCGVEDHVEAVKKLQNSTKLLQKVIYSTENGEGMGSA